jgi:hypothetical protein
MFKIRYTRVSCWSHCTYFVFNSTEVNARCETGWRSSLEWRHGLDARVLRGRASNQNSNAGKVSSLWRSLGWVSNGSNGSMTSCWWSCCWRCHHLPLLSNSHSFCLGDHTRIKGIKLQWNVTKDHCTSSDLQNLTQVHQWGTSSDPPKFDIPRFIRIAFLDENRKYSWYLPDDNK